MFRNLEAEQKRIGLTNAQMAEKLGISRITYEIKKKNRKFQQNPNCYVIKSVPL